jgi:hypothetical protein
MHFGVRQQGQLQCSRFAEACCGTGRARTAISGNPVCTARREDSTARMAMSRLFSLCALSQGDDVT